MFILIISTNRDDKRNKSIRYFEPGVRYVRYPRAIYLLVIKTLILEKQLVFSRVHATLYVTMLVSRSIGPLVHNHFSFLGV